MRVTFRSVAAVLLLVAAFSNPSSLFGQLPPLPPGEPPLPPDSCFELPPGPALPAGIAILTFAGPREPGGAADGMATAARFASAQGMAADTRGNVYVADRGNATVRKITPQGAVTTLAGRAGHQDNCDGTGGEARFVAPTGVAIDTGGNLYVLNHSIRVGRPVLEDTAAIDVTTGAIGAPRQLNTAAQTATAWQWDVIRRPLDAAAELSSTTVRNPTFTPDVARLFTFRLVATNGSAASISTVDFTSVIDGVARRRAVRR